MLNLHLKGFWEQRSHWAFSLEAFALIAPKTSQDVGARAPTHLTKQKRTLKMQHCKLQNRPSKSCHYNRLSTRAVLSPGNRAKPCKFRYVKSLRELHTEDIAIERQKLQNSHFRRPPSHLTPFHQRTPTNIGIRLISPETTDHGLHFCHWQHKICIPVYIKTIMVIFMLNVVVNVTSEWHHM